MTDSVETRDIGPLDENVDVSSVSPEQKKQQETQVIQDISEDLMAHESSMIDQQQQQEQKKHTQQVSQSLEQLHDTSLGTSFSFVEKSPLVQALGPEKAQETFAKLDTLSQGLLHSYFGGKEIMNSLLSGQQQKLLVHSFTLALVDGLTVVPKKEKKQEDGAFDKISGGVSNLLGKFQDALGDKLDGLLGSDGESMDYGRIVGGLFKVFTGVPGINKQGKKLQSLVTAIKKRKSQKLTHDAGKILDWLQGRQASLDDLFVVEPGALRVEELHKLGESLRIGEGKKQLDELVKAQTMQKLVGDAAMQDKFVTMYGAMHSVIDSIGKLFGYDSPKALLQDWGLDGGCNLLLGWFGQDGGLDGLHNRYMLDQVEQDFFDDTQKECLGHAYGLTRATAQQSPTQPDSSFVKKLAATGIGSDHDLFAYVPPNGDFLRTVLQESFAETKALPGIHILQKYCKRECFVMKENDKGEQVPVLNPGGFVLEDFLVRYNAEKSFLHMLSTLKDKDTEHVSSMADLVTMWIGSIFSEEFPAAYIDGALIVEDDEEAFTQPKAITLPSLAASPSPDVSGQGQDGQQGTTVVDSPSFSSVTIESSVGGLAGSVSFPPFNFQRIEALRLADPAPNIEYSKDKDYCLFLIDLAKKHGMHPAMLLTVGFIEAGPAMRMKTTSGEALTSTDGHFSKGTFQFLDGTADEYAKKLNKKYNRNISRKHIQQNPYYAAYAAAEYYSIYVNRHKDSPSQGIFEAVIAYNEGANNLKKKLKYSPEKYAVVMKRKKYYQVAKAVLHGFDTGQFPETLHKRSVGKFLRILDGHGLVGLVSQKSNESGNSFSDSQEKSLSVQTSYTQVKVNNFGKRKSPLETHQRYNNFGVFGENCSRSGRPTKEGLKQLKQRGVKSLVVLTGKFSRKDKNLQLAKDMGFTILHMPIGRKASEISPQSMKEIIKAVRAGGVHIFCDHGADRTGYVCGMIRKYCFGWTSEQALEEVYAYNQKVHPTQGRSLYIDAFADFDAALKKDDFFGIGLGNIS